MDDETISKIIKAILEEEKCTLFDLIEVLNNDIDNSEETIEDNVKENIFDWIVENYKANEIIAELLDTDQITEEEILDCIDDDEIAEYMEGQGYTVEKGRSKKR